MVRKSAEWHELAEVSLSNGGKNIVDKLHIYYYMRCTIETDEQLKKEQQVNIDDFM